MLKEITRIQENTNLKRTLATSENSYHAGSRFMNTLNPKALQTMSQHSGDITTMSRISKKSIYYNDLNQMKNA